MTNEEAEIILIECLLHTKETRIDFFRKKAKEMEISLIPFIKSLFDAYDRLNKIVNTKDFTVWSVDEETGKKEFYKKPINLYHFTNGRLSGNLNDINILEIAEPLVELSKLTLKNHYNQVKEKPRQQPQQTTNINNLTLYEFLDIITGENNSNDLIFTSIEIFNYLSHITSNFENERTKRTLSEIECYYHMVFMERINAESYQKYTENGWDIPLINYGKSDAGVNLNIPDYKQMRKKTHIADDLNIVTTMNLLKKKLTSIDTQKESIKTYIWQNQPEKELPELFNLMLGNFIASDTTLDQFKAIFTGQAVDTIKPIEWLTKKNLLAYFIDELYDKKRLSKYVNTNSWSIASHCFVDAKNLSQIVDQYKNNKTGLPKDYHIIDELLNSL